MQNGNEYLQWWCYMDFLAWKVQLMADDRNSAEGKGVHDMCKDAAELHNVPEHASTARRQILRYCRQVFSKAKNKI